LIRFLTFLGVLPASRIESLGRGEEITQSRTSQIGRILFLGYDRSKTRLIDEVVSRGFEVVHSDKVVSSTNNFDLVISFGYRHIISSETITDSKCRIINLHTSMLPWNRGAHPVFWSFFDNTPLGVSVHEIDGGIDTGPVIAQRQVFLETAFLTFENAHERMIQEIEALFMAVFNEIVDGTCVATPQIGIGSFHKTSDLPKAFAGWASEIDKEIQRLKSLENS